MAMQAVWVCIPGKGPCHSPHWAGVRKQFYLGGYRGFSLPDDLDGDPSCFKYCLPLESLAP